MDEGEFVELKMIKGSHGDRYIGSLNRSRGTCPRGSYDKQLFSCVYLTCNPIVAYNQYMNWDKDAIFKALSDSTRRLILDELSERNELTLYELTARLIMKHNLSISRQAIAKHLSALEEAGLVTSKRKGKYRVLIFHNEPLRNLLKGWVE